MLPDCKAVGNDAIQEQIDILQNIWHWGIKDKIAAIQSDILH